LMGHVDPKKLGGSSPVGAATNHSGQPGVLGSMHSPRLQQRVCSNPSPMIEYFETLRGYLPTSPRAGVLGSVPGVLGTSLKDGMNETLLARWQAKLATNPELSWMMRAKGGEMENHMASLALEFQVNEKVKVITEEKVRDATVMYVGRVPEIGPGFWVGVEFDFPEGKNDGTIGGTSYFEGRSGHGSFLRPDRIKRVASETAVAEIGEGAAPEEHADQLSPVRAQKAKPGLKLKGASAKTSRDDKSQRSARGLKELPQRSARSASSSASSKEQAVVTSSKHPPSRRQPTGGVSQEKSPKKTSVRRLVPRS